MKPFFILFVWIIPKKADDIASGFTNAQEPTEFKIGSNPHKNRTPPPLWIQLIIHTSSLSVIREPRSINSSKNSQNHPKFESEPAKQPNPKSTDLNHGRFCSSDDKLCNRWCSNLRPEGNIRPNPLVFFSLLSFWNWNSETWHHTHTSKFLNFRCQTSFCRILPTQNPFVLSHKPMKTP